MCIIFWQHPTSGFPRFYTMCKHKSEVLPPASCDSSLPSCLTPDCNTIFMCILKKAVEPKDSSLPHGKRCIICQQLTCKNFQNSKKSPQLRDLPQRCSYWPACSLALTAGLFMHLYGDLAVVLCRLLLRPPSPSGWNSSAVQSAGHA